MIHWVTQILAVLTGLEFIYIFYLETVRTDSGQTAKTFGLDVSVLQRPEMKMAMKNQGVYNLGIALLVLCDVFFLDSKPALAGLMAFIVLVALYGSLTVDRKILLKQGGLAILTLASCLL